MFQSLHRRPRGQVLALALNTLTGGRVPPPHEYAVVHRWAHAIAEQEPAVMEVPGPVTRLLCDRLTPDDRRELEERLYGEAEVLWREARPEERPYLSLALALHVDVPGVAERTGLLRTMPPDEVHLMGRGPAATGGSYYHADLVAEALCAVEGGAMPGGRGLDFGCSSGRVVRVLAAAYPDVEWHGCDPLPDAISWADRHLPFVSFVQSPHDPPLPYADDSMDFAFAISVWSHFDADAGLRWLDEMRRILRPGGLLVATVQGWKTLHHLAQHGLWLPDDIHAVGAELVHPGFAYRPTFETPEGDHGIVRTDWGWGLMTPDWLLRHVTPDWTLELFRPGAVEGSQDIVVLRAR